MSGSPFAQQDFASALQGLLPTGAVWPREPDAVQSQLIEALALTYQRLANRDANLLVDAFPNTTDELLTEWESTVGLPDPCTPLAATIPQRVAAVAAKVAAAGGQSAAYYTSVAAALGYAITITPYRPFRAGDPVGGPLRGPAWMTAWNVSFATGASDAELQCRLQQIAPAHTTLFFTIT